MFKRRDAGLTQEQEALADTLATGGETRDARSLAETIAAGAGDVIEAMSDDVTVLGPDDRYVRKGTLGSGGMGEVHLCSDRQIGRDIALKLAHASHTRDRTRRARFVREARVQGQLEHPAVVPVYDLAHDGDGCTFFTMKRISGDTLEDVLEGRRSGAREYSLHKLLAAFVRICLAVDFAHARGVVHRDQKPANVMLGAFGEVYVLDWGIAKLVAGAAATREDGGDADPKTSTRSSGGTVAGTILGTPAYMAPEQLDNAEQVDGRADVYSLGAILFEILTREPLHGGGSLKGMLERVRQGVEVRPSVRAPDVPIPPELEEICVRAAAKDPRDRFASARALADAIEAHLSGDRDLELRQKLAEQHLESARAAAQRAFEDGAPATERTDALREVGRAIALAPEDERALRLLVRLLTEPPRTVPLEVLADVDQTRIASQRRMLGVAAAMYSSVGLLFGVVSVILGVADAALVGTSIGAWLGAGGVAFYGAKLARAEHGIFRAVTIAGAIAIASTSLLFGGLIVVPALAAVNGMGHVLTTARSNRAFVVAMNSLAIAVPTVLDLTGVHPVKHLLLDQRSVQIGGGGVLWPAHALGVLACLAIGILLFAAGFASRYRDALTQAETRNAMHMWQLRGLVPEGGQARSP